MVQSTDLHEDEVIEQVRGEAVLQLADLGLCAQVAALAQDGAVRVGRAQAAGLRVVLEMSHLLVHVTLQWPIMKMEFYI